MLEIEYLMQRALHLAELGDGHVLSNPMVGALVVKKGRVIGYGHHEKFGEGHAEIKALDQCTESPEGATLICTLEPCCHSNKKTPPCVDRIIKEKIAEVIIASRDVNPQVAGEGIRKLKAAGVKVKVGILKEEEEKLNERYRYFMKTKRPFVLLKWAQTLDGFIATKKNSSQWISNEKSRVIAHDLRGRYGAVAVGSNTVRDDNPRLTVRHGLEDRYPQPHRVVFSNLLNINKEGHLFTDSLKHKTIVFTHSSISNEWREHFEKNKVKAYFLERDSTGLINVEEALKILGEEGIPSLLVEGGRTLHHHFIKSKLFQKLTVFIAPKLLGEGKSALKNFHINEIKDALEVEHASTDVIDGDIIAEYYSRDK